MRQDIGDFREKDHGLCHWYGAASESEHGQWVRLYNLPHVIWTRDGYRLARILKTVAYVAVDENAMGIPVLEKWQITRHRVYPNHA